MNKFNILIDIFIFTAIIGVHSNAKTVATHLDASESTDTIDNVYETDSNYDHDYDYDHEIQKLCDSNYFDSVYSFGAYVTLRRGNWSWTYNLNSGVFGEAVNEPEHYNGRVIRAIIYIASVPRCADKTSDKCRDINNSHDMFLKVFFHPHNGKESYEAFTLNDNGEIVPKPVESMPWNMSVTGVPKDIIWPKGWTSHTSYRPVIYDYNDFTLNFIVNRKNRKPLIVFYVINDVITRNWERKEIEDVSDTIDSYVGMFSLNGKLYTVGEQKTKTAKGTPKQLVYEIDFSGNKVTAKYTGYAIDEFFFCGNISRPEKVPEFCSENKVDACHNANGPITLIRDGWGWWYDHKRHDIYGPTFREHLRDRKTGFYFHSLPECKRIEKCKSIESKDHIKMKHLLITVDKNGKNFVYETIRGEPNTDSVTPIKHEEMPWEMQPIGKVRDGIWPNDWFEKSDHIPANYWTVKHEMIFIVNGGTNDHPKIVWYDIFDARHRERWNQKKLMHLNIQFIALFQYEDIVYAIGQENGNDTQMLYQYLAHDNDRTIEPLNLKMYELFGCGERPIYKPTVKVNLKPKSVPSESNNDNGEVSTIIIVILAILLTVLIILFIGIGIFVIIGKKRNTMVLSQSQNEFNSDVWE